MAMTKILSSLSKGFAEFKGTTVNTLIGAATIALEEILNQTMYFCPCVDLGVLGDCNTTSSSQGSKAQCTPTSNYVYGMVYIMVPAITLFVLSIATTTTLWKLWTGICTRSREGRKRSEKLVWTLAGAFAQALVAPVVWISFALLDGRYYACSVTPLPYDVGVGATYASCTAVAETSTPTYSDAYQDNRSYSQIYGWGFLAVSLLVGFGGFAVSRCMYPLTYYHAKYYDLYRKHEESEFDQEMDVKAQKQAESNVLKFMSKYREKKLWDRISTVFSFHRNPKNVALYSYLHEFVLQEENKPRPENGETEESDSDTPTT